MIYFIQSGEYVKVGYTGNLKSRYKQYVTENPNPVYLLATINGGYDIERKIHKQLKEFKHRGEWFVYTDQVKEKIALIIKENILNVEPPRAKVKRDKYRHLKTLLALKEAANGAEFIVLTKDIRANVCKTVEIVTSTLRNHIIKLEKLRKLRVIESQIWF